MFCKNCGTQLPDSAPVCHVCGKAPNPVDRPAPQAYSTPTTYSYYSIPEEYRPLSPWSYFGLSLLFSVPVVGFVFLIVFSFNDSNMNRRNYARSYWCALLIAAIAIAVVATFGAILGSF